MLSYRDDLLFGLNTSFQELEQAYRHNNIKEMNYRAGTCVLWLINCADRVRSSISNDINFFQAFRCINNCLKHNSHLVNIQIEKGVCLPMTLPFTLGFNYIWAPLADAEDLIEQKAQLKCYKELLEGRNVLATIKSARDIITQVYSELQN